MDKLTLTDRQKKMIDLLSDVTFLPGSWDKRFARNVGAQNVITEKQAVCLDKMFHRYRRQIPNHKRWCSVCGERLAAHGKSQDEREA